MNKQQKAFAEASRRIAISVNEARQLPGILGQIVPLQLSVFGWYARRNPDGSVVYYSHDGR